MIWCTVCGLPQLQSVESFSSQQNMLELKHTTPVRRAKAIYFSWVDLFQGVYVGIWSDCNLLGALYKFT